MSGFPYGPTVQYEDRPPPLLRFSQLPEKTVMTGWNLVPFPWSKALIYSPHVYLDKFYKGSQIEEKCQISLLTTQPRPFSPLQWSNLGIFQSGPGYFSIFFPNRVPPIQYLSPGWAILLASFSQPPTQYLWTGWEFLGIFHPRPTQCLDHKWACPRCFTTPHTHPVSFLLGGGK